jgi:hypothetical protein
VSDAYAYEQALELEEQLTESSRVAAAVVERSLPVAAPAARKPIRRDAMFRRLLAVADLVAAAGGLAVLASLSGRSIKAVTLLTLPVIILVAKLSGRYDHDEVVLHKSTLDEIPQLLALAACFSLIWSLAAYLVGVRLHLDGAGVAVLWGATALFLVGLPGGCTDPRAAARSSRARADCRQRGRPQAARALAALRSRRADRARWLPAPGGRAPPA